jgi:virginiamycin A acetyltransferase
MDGISAYPFAVFGKKWSGLYEANFPNKGDTIIGNDVWFGFESLVMPAVKIGDGAIIGSRSVVTKDVPSYSVVAGNPARVVKQRFNDKDIKRLLEIAWWNWPYEVIEDNMQAIVDSDIDALMEVYEPIKK